jgi:ATP-binding cassette subfamily B protein
MKNTKHKPQVDEELRALSRSPFGFYYRRYWRSFGLGVFGLALTDLLDVLPPLLIKMAIDQLTNHAPFSAVVQTALIFLGLTCSTALARYLWRMAWGHFEHAAGEDLRKKLFAKCTQLGPSHYQKTSVGEIMSLATNDINAFRMGVGPGTLVLLDGLFLMTFMLPIMAWLSWSLTWKTLILMPLLPFIIRRMESLIHKYFNKQQELFSQLSTATQELTSGIRVIKAYGRQAQQLTDFNKISVKYQNAANRTARLDAFFQPVMEFGITSGIVILLFLASDPDTTQALSVGTFVAFFQYIRKMSWPMTAIGLGITMREEGRASFARIDQLLQTDSDILYEGTAPVKTFAELEVRNLSFTYPSTSTPALNDVSFRLKAGETLGVIGPVGSGKSTLIKLLTRQYPFPPKTIFINGSPLEDLKEEQLRNLITIVPQEPFLFSQSIRDNLSLGLTSPPNLELLQNITKQVNIHGEIIDIPGAYEAELGERGVNLSGGQKQRLTLARALVRQSALTIFDDALSAVDANTESAILNQLQKKIPANRDQRSSSIIVTHRLASVRYADKIIVLNHGRVEAYGTHHELTTISPTYIDLCRLQGFRSQSVSGVRELQ